MIALGLGCPGDDGGSDGADTGSTGGDDDGSGTMPATTMGQTATSLPTETDTMPTTTGIDPLCGNGDLDGDEQCDDGNNDDGDSCRADCTLPAELTWQVSYNGPTDGFDVFSAIVTDDAGNIYAAGNTATVTGRDAIVKQYMPDGSEGWTYIYDGGMSGDDFALDIALHPSGDVLITGTSAEAEGDDILAIRIRAVDQNEEWIQTYDGPGMMDGNDDIGRGIYTDSAGDVIVVGHEEVDTERDNVWVRKLEPGNGNEVWTFTYNNMMENGVDFARDVLVDGSDEILVSGNEETAMGLVGFVRRLSPAGIETDLLAPLDFEVTELAFDTTGNILISGSADDTGDFNAIAMKYAPDFTFMWQAALGSTGAEDLGTAIASDGMDNVFLVGSLTVVGEQRNLLLGKFGPDGTAQWTATYNNMRAGLEDSALGVMVDPDGAIVVCGFETVLGEQSNGWLGKYNEL